MASFFISHSSSDREDAERLRVRLVAHGFESLFLDFDPEDGIPAGRDWERELYKQLQIADALIYLGSPDASESRWCFAELALARSVGKPIFPILLRGSERHPLLEDTQWVDLTADSDAGLARLWNALERSGFDPRDAFSWDLRRPPYPGLAPFEPEDAAMFFGRRDKIDELLDHLHPTLKRGEGRFIAVIGASGTGKSSLVRAGLIPRLGQVRERWITVPPFAPGARPTAALARSLGIALQGIGRRDSWQSLEDTLDRDADALAGLTHDLSYAGEGAAASVLLIVDQAEELTTLADDGERARFVERLARARHASAPLWVVGTFRSEFLTTSLEDSAVAALIDDSVVLGPLDRSRIPEVIEGPAKRVGLQFEPGLVGRMVEDTRGGDALPLLAYTLQQLYERAGKDGRITIGDYEAIGGVLGALRRSADRVAHELTRRERGDRIIPTLLELVRLDGGTEPARARVLRRELDETENEIVQAFVEARLLKTEGSREDATVEVAHEALLRVWTPLSEAIEASRDDLRIRSELERVATEWDESMLYRGARLQRAIEWRDRTEPALAPRERGFLEASVAAEQTELEREKQRSRRLRILVIGLVVFLAFAAVAAVYALRQSRRAEQQTRTANSQRLAVLTRDNLAERLPVAILLALEAYRSDATPEARSVALTSLRRSDGVIGFLHLDEDADSLFFSPDGRFVLTIAAEEQVEVWDSTTRRSVGRVDLDYTPVAVALHPDGTRVAAASDSGKFELWNVVGRKRLWSQRGSVSDLTITPDGKGLVVAGSDGTITRWSMAGRRVDSLDLRPRPGKDLTLSLNGTRVVSNARGTVWVWDLARGRPVVGIPKIPTDHELQLSPDGRHLLSTGATELADSKIVTVWSLVAAEPPAKVDLGNSAGISGVPAVALHPSGKTLAVATFDGTVLLYDVATSELLTEPLSTGGDVVWALDFSPDGKTLAWSNNEATLTLWDTTRRRGLSRPLRGHSEEGAGVAFRPGTDMLASASYDGTIRFWNVDTGSPIGMALTPLGGVSSIAFSKDGLLAIGGEDGHLRLWNVGTGAWHGPSLTGATGDVSNVAISSVAPIVAAVTDDGDAVRLWRIGRREPIGSPLLTDSPFNEGLSFGPDGTLAWTDGTLVRFWDVERSRPALEPLGPHDDDVTSVAFSPDGAVLASGTESGSVDLWDVASGTRLGEPLRGHRQEVLDLAFAPDGKTVASASIEGTIRLWDVATRRSLGEPLTGHDDDATGLAFSRDGKTLASVGSLPVLILWKDLLWSDDREVLTRHLCPLVGRNLTRAEWAEFMPGADYRKTCDEWPIERGGR